MIAWMLTSTLAGLLLVLAAHLAESALRARGCQARGVWAGAMLATIGLSARALVATPAPEGARAGGHLDVTALLVPGGTVGRVTRTVAEGVEPWLPIVWILLSTTLLFTVAAGVVRLLRRSHGWSPEYVAGVRVLVSDDFGPAVLGVFSGRVVLPRWALSLPADHLRLVLAHEEEHRRAKDPAVLIGGMIGAAIMPWNAALWWHFFRLRDAVEVDCDRRVLRRGVPPVTYGRLLLDLGTRAVHAPLPVAALARNSSLLERRLVTMVRPTETPRWGRSAFTSLAVATLVVVACDAPTPVGLEPAEPASPDAGTFSFTEPTGETVRGQAGGAEGSGVIHRSAPDAEGGSAFYGPDGTGTIRKRTTARAPSVTAGQAEEPATTRTAGEEPNIYIDGVLARRSFLADIEPDDIDRVEIVKNPEQRAIYIFLKKTSG